MTQDLIVVPSPGGVPTLEWAPVPEPPSPAGQGFREEIHRRFSGGGDDWLLFLGCAEPPAELTPSLAFWRRFAETFVRRLSRAPELERLRDRVEVPADAGELAELLAVAPPMTGGEYLSTETLNAMWERLTHAFAAAIRGHEGTVESFFQAFRPDIHVAGRVYFHLVENRSDESPFAFLATYSTRLDEKGAAKHLPLRNALQEYGEDQRKLLSLLVTVHRAAERSALVAELVESGELFHPLGWTAREAFTFLKEAPLYEEAGVLCRIPNWWRSAARPRVRIRVGDRTPSLLGMDAILSFDARIFIGDTELTEEEARRLMAESQGLALIKGKWVAADPERLRQTLAAYEKARDMMETQGLTLRDALRFQLQPDHFLKTGADETEIQWTSGQWMASVMEKLRDPALPPPADPGREFAATLRPYQRRGLNWLWFLHSLRFGACLADDMGLGKTVQILGFLSALKAASSGSRKASLLVLPASLIPNWMSEIERFAPGLEVFVAHPALQPTKTVDPKTPAELDALDLVITSYALVKRYEWLQSHEWAYVILDEAQAIKNPGSQQTRAVKKLAAENRIVMTGTPVENRLSDLWSLFDFLNPGLLGTAKSFGTFAKEAQTDPSGYARLRGVVRPYILRRLKTDKSVISDLPDKVEMKTYAPLSKKQVVLYETLARDIARSIEESEGIQRKGLILAALLKFKQICNHPDQYLGAGDFEEKHGGKFGRLREICETIHEKRERVLVFSQFREMTEPLARYLAGVFGREGLILHGGVPVGKRKKIVETFQARDYVPFLVLSLKAGGVGLNLTAANHVIHFDRWWNPAVENQATDRAFRIGQKKNVMVHKFLTQGTVEEKIDRMLAEKTRLTESVVAAAGENWITEMSTGEVMELFRLTL